MQSSAFRSAAAGQVIRVQLIDDSAVVRGLTRRWLTGHSDIDLIAVSVDGAQGVKDAAEHRPDVIILDVEMPRMDGLEALPHLRRAAPKAKILMASTLTHKGANTTIRALSLGASDYLPKPEAGQIGGADAYRDSLLEKIRIFGSPERARAPALPAKPLKPFAAPQTPAQAARPGVASQDTSVTPSKPGLRPIPMVRNRTDAIVIASSTGGPQALQSVLPNLCKSTTLPVLIVQHMPATFTKILADHLNATCNHTVKEGEQGEPVQPSTVYIAPGGYHMSVTKRTGRATIELDQGPQVNFCRPAADVLFKSAADVYGGHLAAVVLTGMGSDGCQGLAPILEKGGRTFIQDQESSVVWGMPGSVFNAGFAHSMHALPDIASAVEKYLKGGR